MSLQEQNLVTMARIGRLYGIRGWVKLISYTDPLENIREFRHLYARIAGQWQVLEMDQCKAHGKGLVAHFLGYDDPDLVRTLTGVELAVNATDLPVLEEEEFYWYELTGMKVMTADARVLGVVVKMLETGANDVIVVAATPDSIDDRERLIPYLPERVIKAVSREQRCITVDWDPEYLA
jgi:16S rRNA processing protein RimM